MTVRRQAWVKFDCCPPPMQKPTPGETAPEWWKIKVPIDDLPQSYQLASIIFLTSSGPDSAWRTLLKTFRHGMAWEAENSRRTDNVQMWAPNSYETRVVNLQQAHSQLIERAIRNLAVPSISSDPSLTTAESANPNVGLRAKVQEELQDLCTAISPATYLQVRVHCLEFYCN